MADKPLMFKTTTLGWKYVDSVPAVTQITDVDYPGATVPGIVYLDGTYYVMTAEGVIYGSAIDDPLSWSTLNTITAETEVDAGVAITKYLNYLVAFGQWSTEFFYDAAQPAPGSPLLRAENMFLQVGCAAAYSIAQCDNSIIWLAQNKEGSSKQSGGRSIVRLTGTQTKVISTQFIERILNVATLDTLYTYGSVYSYAFKHNGHSFYLLTLTASNITLVYDLDVSKWYIWSSMTVQAPKTVTSITRVGSIATVTLDTHGYADGDVVTHAGAGQTEYNVTTNITYIDANTYSYTVSGTPATPATGTITATGYTEGYFKLLHHTATPTQNLFADATTGKLYALTENNYDDNGAYINMLVRTTNIDNGNVQYKLLESVDIIGDKVTGSALVRYSKNDYQTQSAYRKVDLALNRSHLSRIGRARRVSFDLRVTDSIPVRLERMDVQIEGGE